MDIQEIIAQIRSLDQDAMQAARTRQSDLTKPPGSLGRLEELSIQVAGITANPQPRLVHKVVLIMASDHGLVAEGVSAYPQAFTAQMVANFLHGGAAINGLARHVGARVVVVDMGIAADMPGQPDLISRKIAYGTQHITRGPVMSRVQALRCLEAGAGTFLGQMAAGLDILATGEMGIGNTTPSAAIAAAVTGQAVEEIAGRGTGVDESGLRRKIEAIRRALEINWPDPRDGLDLLSKLGGFEIGGLAGAILAAAANWRPVVIDGFISTAAAIIAVCLAPTAREYLIAAHTSLERGHHLMMDWLGVRPLLNLQMRLGEGTGAALAMSLIEAACKTLSEMATFSEASVSEKVAA